MEVVAGELAQEREQGWVSLGGAILQSGAQVDAALGVGNVAFLRDEDSLCILAFIRGRLEALWLCDGGFEGVIGEVGWVWEACEPVLVDLYAEAGMNRGQGRTSGKIGNAWNQEVFVKVLDTARIAITRGVGVVV